MELNKMLILVLFICFYFIFSAPIPIQNFETISFPEGTTEYYYQFSEPILQDGKDAYFFFKFSYDYRITLTIKDEDNNENPIKIESDDIYLKYKVENLKTQKYIFVVKNEYWGTESMIFIDNSREINAEFENLLTFNFDTEEIEGKPPLPLIFNLDPLEEYLYFLFDASYDSDTIYDGNSKLEYCQIDGNECSFKGNETNMFFEKGKAYKIKYNCNQKSSDIYSFKKYKISSVVREVEMGYHGFSLDSNFNEFYFILDVKNYEKFNIYVQLYRYDFDYAFINKDEKKEFLENKIDFYSFERKSGNSKSLIEMNNKKDYLIILIKYFGDPEKGFLYFFSLFQNIRFDETFEIEKGRYALIRKSGDSSNQRKYILVSSNKNMGMLNSQLNSKSLTNILILDDYNSNYLILVDSSKEKTNLKYYAYTKSRYDEINLYLIPEKNITYYLNKYGPDSLFMRTTSNHIDFIYNYTYLFDLEANYYLYNRKYYGNIDFYKYSKELNCFSDIIQFMNSYYFSNNLNEYDLVNNQLLIISGYQLFSYFNSYGSLYDLYFQKVNDLEQIQINSEMFPYNNLVKLLKENKLYYLDFNVDHLIKLDKEFLEAEVTFIDVNNNTYILNKEKKVLRDLKGEGIVVKANKKALIYFYKKMDNFTEQGIIEFNISQIGKNMKFNITSKNNNYINIFIAQDFGFKGYYPMLSMESFNKIVSRDFTSTIYVDNLYDKLEKNDFYEDEGEKYYIYIFDSKKDNLPIFNPEKFIISESTYLDNLLSPKNKNGFNIIPGNSNGSIVLNVINKNTFEYQFFTCKNAEIKFKIENSNGYFYYYYNYPFEEIINDNKKNHFYLIYKNEILSLSFESNNEFLFSFYFNNPNTPSCNSNIDFNIMSIYELSRNIIQVKFTPKYQDCESQYYLIIAKKDELNNNESFSDPCYLLKLFSQNSTNSIIIKPIIEEKNNLIITNIDISKLNASENSELIATIINYMNTYDFYKPLEFILKPKNSLGFELEEIVEFNFVDKNFFKFEFKHEDNLPQEIYFSFDSHYNFILYLSDNNKTIKYEYDKDNAEIMKIPFEKTGTYYIEFYSPYASYYVLNSAFTAFIPEKLIDTIDLTQKMYYKISRIKTKSKVNPDRYKVSDIKKDMYVYFTFNIENEENEEFNNPFEVCNDNNNECIKNVTLFRFVKGNEYTIKINYCTKNDWDYHDDYYYFYPSYLFFPINEDTLEEKKEGFYNILAPKIYYVNLKNKGKLFLYHENLNQVCISYSKNEDILNNLQNLDMRESSSIYDSIIEKEGFNYGILLIIPFINNKDGKLIIVNEIIRNENQEEIIISAGNNAIIIYQNKDDDDEENELYRKIFSKKKDNGKEKNYLKEQEYLEEEFYWEEEEDWERDKKGEDDISYNVLTIFYSEEKNMRLLNGNDLESSDFIAQNSYPLPIYVGGSKNEIKIKIKIYEPKFAFFAAFHNNLIDSYISLFSYLSENSNVYDLYDLNQLFPLNLRINTDLSAVYEFINFYLYKSEKNINIYIKKLYGETDIYECDKSIDRKDLSIITKPISYCENKKSILNKIYNFKGTKLITGYWGHNSYLDIYIELDNTKNITLSSLMKGSLNCASKYLKKNIEYTLDFNVEHLVKLDPEFNAKIIIYDDLGNNFIINSENPTVEIKGNNFKIISDNDVMIYFYGKLMEGFEQIKINSEIGKNLEIKMKKDTLFILDFGFEGYNPMDISSLLTGSRFDKDGILYIENIYDKLKPKLVKGESLYLYCVGYDENIEISYNYPNINNPKNEYTFHVISKNDENSTLIINNANMEKIKYHINFCQSPHDLKMFYQSGESFLEQSFEFNGEITTKEQNIDNKPFKLRFESKEEFVFSYSFIDAQDKLFNKKDEWINQRKELTNLKINEIKKKSENSKVISIKFYPNYKESSARYIIVIAQKNEIYSKEKLSNPCFIAKLVTEKAEGIKIINSADIGESDLIYIEADISEILNDGNNTFIVSIISQELRFEKKLHFYTPYEFSDTFEDKKGLSTLYIVLISVFGFILIVVILFFILRCCKKRRNDDFERQTVNMSQEKLMSDL